MVDVERGGGNRFLGFVGAVLMGVVAAMGLFLYSGGTFGPQSADHARVSLPPSPGVAGD